MLEYFSRKKIMMFFGGVGGQLDNNTIGVIGTLDHQIATNANVQHKPINVYFSYVKPTPSQVTYFHLIYKINVV
jgi:hypothetical protein